MAVKDVEDEEEGLLGRLRRSHSSAGVPPLLAYYLRKKRFYVLVGILLFAILSLVFLLGSGDLDEDGAGAPPAISVDAFALIALSKVSTSPALPIVVDSIRTTGGWEGPIYLITDSNLSCSNKRAMSELKVQVLNADWRIDETLEAERADVCRTVALNKCGMLQNLPLSVKSVLYIDSDILVTRPLQPFLRHLGDFFGSGYDVALFPDADSHTFKFCANCDTWHGGVIGMRREQSETCLEAWCGEISEHGCPDQLAMDAVIDQGHCQSVSRLDPKYMKFMQDYFKIGTYTFSHFTGLFSPPKTGPLGWLQNIMYRLSIGSERFDSILDVKGGSLVHHENELC